MLFVESPDGHRIQLHFQSCPTSDIVTVFVHGLFNNCEERILRVTGDAIKEFSSSVRFDFRGHGASPVSSIEFYPSTALVDLQTVMNWAKEFTGAKAVNLAASSYGGSIALLYCGLRLQPQPDRVLLFNPVLSYKQTFGSKGTEWGQRILNKQIIYNIRNNGRAKLTQQFIAGLQFINEMELIEPEAYIGSLPLKTIAFHGKNDLNVNYLVTEELLKNKVDIRVLDGAGHGFKDKAHQTYVVKESAKFLLS